MSIRKFLIVDDNADSRFLLAKTLMRKFPQAVIQECQDSDAAAEIARTEPLDAVVVHRTGQTDGGTLIKLMRAANPTLPIIMVSGIDRAVQAKAAGATRFLHYDEWLRIGSVAAELIEGRESGPAAPSR